jgi:hypothetical protein
MLYFQQYSLHLFLKIPYFQVYPSMSYQSTGFNSENINA